MNTKQIVSIAQCLANPTRVKILEWLKEPDVNFPPSDSSVSNDQGICVGAIQEKAGLTQSTISTYLSNMERCGLLTTFRSGKWSYYARHNQTLKDFYEAIK